MPAMVAKYLLCVCGFWAFLPASQFISVNAFSGPVTYSRANGFITFAPVPPPRPQQRVSRTRLKETADIKGDDVGKEDKNLRVVVVGGGWAGYSFCESISTNNIDVDNVDVILLDASKQAKGGLAGGYRSSNDRPVEAGIHGFWREYRNTFDIMSDIEGVNVDDVLGDFSPSVLWSKNGKVAVAPVLVEDEQGGNVGDRDKIPTLNDLSEKSIRRFIAAQLPPPLDLPILAELDNSKSKSGDSKLNLSDLLSGLGLLGAWADFGQESPESWENYDTQPASRLFEKAGISNALYDELVSPLLHVLPMCPAYDCSAAAALSCFHVFALQSRGAFDVRWCRGSISEKIFEPWQHQLENRGVVVQGGSRVSSIEKTNNGYTIQLASMNGDENGVIECDAVVLAVGATAAGKLASSSPAISSLPAANNFDKLRGVTCVAVRLFIKPNRTMTANLNGGSHNKTQLPPDMAEAMSDSPISVCGAGIGDIEELKETGFCIYDLQRMHDEFSVEYYNNNVEESDQVAVLEIDFYRADSFVDMDDDQITDLSLRAASAAFGSKQIDSDDIIDAIVLRARNAVSHFAPNSALYSPDVKLEDGMYICGDWVDRKNHASWSTEKSVVTARQAAAALSRDFGLKDSRCQVIPAAKDTPQLTAMRQSTRLLRNILPPKTLPPSPWVYAKQLLSGERDP
mmetsp:Transcript_12713/g.31022  ORF Transcript_12713/g.31022 Transcript_12713/m.31022 type:complete len:683 (+) Transcript_12713:170-2218(+)